MSIESWLFNVGVACALLWVAWLASRQFRGWLAPSAFFCLYWAAALFGVLVLAPDFEMRPGAIPFILSAAVALHIGALVGVGLCRPVRQDTQIQYRLSAGWGKLILAATTVAGMLATYVLVSTAGISIRALFSAESLTEINRYYFILRYVEIEAPPTIYNVFSSILYFGGLFAGIWFEMSARWRDRALIVFPMASGLLNAFLMNVRMGFVWMSVFFVSGYLAALVLNHKHNSFFSARRVAALVAIAVFFGAFVLVIQVIRHRTELDDSELALLKTRVNLFSSPAVFSQWLEVEGGNLDPAWGAHTFGGPAKLLEGESRVRSLGWQGTSVELAGYVFTPNVYTAFRQLIEDFTLPGALVVMLLWGGLSGRAYWEVLRGKRRWLPVLILFYSVTLASYLSNWMNYNTLLLAWLMLWALFHLPSIRLLARKPAEKAQPVLRTKSRYRLSSPGHAN